MRAAPACSSSATFWSPARFWKASLESVSGRQPPATAREPLASRFGCLPLCIWDLPCERTLMGNVGGVIVIPAIWPLIGPGRSELAPFRRVNAALLSMRKSMRCRTPTDPAGTKKPQRLEPRWGVSFKMNRLSNDVLIAAIPPGVCELVHTPCGIQIKRPRGNRGRQPLWGRFSLRPGGFWGWGWAESLDSTLSRRSRSKAAGKISIGADRCIQRPIAPDRSTASSDLSARTTRARTPAFTEAHFETIHFHCGHRTACDGSCTLTGAGRPKQGCPRVSGGGREAPGRAAAAARMRNERGSREGAAEGSHRLSQPLSGHHGGQAIALIEPLDRSGRCGGAMTAARILRAPAPLPASAVTKRVGQLAKALQAFFRYLRSPEHSLSIDDRA